MGFIKPFKALADLQKALCPLRLARPRTPPFHGGDAGSNPAGDANSDHKKTLGDPGLFYYSAAGGTP